MYHEKLNRLGHIFNLSAFQMDVLARNPEKYDLDRIQQSGEVIIAPYRSHLRHHWWDGIARILFGPRGDRIGQDTMIEQNVHSRRR